MRTCQVGGVEIPDGGVERAELLRLLAAAAED